MGRPRSGGWLLWVLLVVAAIPFVVPLGWLVLSAFKTPAQLYGAPGTWLPDPLTIDGFTRGAELLDLPRLILNSLFVAVLSVVGTIVSSSLAGFAFAVLPARGKGVLFGLMLATIMVPPAVTLIPQFILFSRLGWTGSFLPLIVPAFFASAVYVFLFRQWFKGLPAALIDAAELDGCTPLGVWRRVAMPLARPVIATVAVFAFVGSWNDLLGPLVYLDSARDQTVSVGLASFQGTYVNQLHLHLPMSVLALLPVVLVVVVAQRQLVDGIVAAPWNR
jgi:ABC-type glycerol-3-phosphate transport system permease component